MKAAKSSLASLGTHTLLLPTRTPVAILDLLARAPEFVEFLRKLLFAFLLHHQAPQPAILLLKPVNLALQRRNFVRELFRGFLQSLLALLLLHAEASRGGGVTAAFVLFGGQTG